METQSAALKFCEEVGREWLSHGDCLRVCGSRQDAKRSGALHTAVTCALQAKPALPAMVTWPRQDELVRRNT